MLLVCVRRQCLIVGRMGYKFAQCQTNQSASHPHMTVITDAPLGCSGTCAAEGKSTKQQGDTHLRLPSGLSGLAGVISLKPAAERQPPPARSPPWESQGPRCHVTMRRVVAMPPVEALSAVAAPGVERGADCGVCLLWRKVCGVYDPCGSPFCSTLPSSVWRAAPAKERQEFIAGSAASGALRFAKQQTPLSLSKRNTSQLCCSDMMNVSRNQNLKMQRSSEWLFMANAAGSRTVSRSHPVLKAPGSVAKAPAGACTGCMALPRSRRAGCWRRDARRRDTGPAPVASMKNTVLSTS